MLLSDYYDKWNNRKEDYLNGIDEDLWRSINVGPYCFDNTHALVISETDNIIAQGNN